MHLEDEVKFVKGVGPNRAELLNKLEIRTLEDLITYYPREYEDRSQPKKIAECLDGEEVLIEGIAMNRLTESRIRRNMVLYKLVVRDDSGACQITWFNQSYLKNKFEIGKKYRFFGKVSNHFGKIEMNNPVFDTENTTKNTGKIVPIYPLTYQLSQNVLRQIIENGIKVAGTLEESLPEYMLKDQQLMERNEAIHKIHFPDTMEDIPMARYRLAFEELLGMQLARLSLKNQYTKDH